MNLNEIVKLMANRYGTADPFQIADALNIEVDWFHAGNRPLGKTTYDHDKPIILLNENIKHTPSANFVMGHELGHVVLQEGLVGYYTGNRMGYSKLENQANEFSVLLMSLLFIEENDRYPSDWTELSNEYGLPHTTM